MSTTGWPFRWNEESPPGSWIYVVKYFHRGREIGRIVLEARTEIEASQEAEAQRARLACHWKFDAVTITRSSGEPS